MTAGFWLFIFLCLLAVILFLYSMIANNGWSFGFLIVTIVVIFLGFFIDTTHIEVPINYEHFDLCALSDSSVNKLEAHYCFIGGSISAKEEVECRFLFINKSTGLAEYGSVPMSQVKFNFKPDGNTLEVREIADYTSFFSLPAFIHIKPLFIFSVPKSSVVGDYTIDLK